MLFRMQLSGILEKAKLAQILPAMMRHGPECARLLTGLLFDICGGENC
jgi:hypothetical protein